MRTWGEVHSTETVEESSTAFCFYIWVEYWYSLVERLFFIVYQQPRYTQPCGVNSYEWNDWGQLAKRDEGHKDNYWLNRSIDALHKTKNSTAASCPWKAGFRFYFHLKIIICTSKISIIFLNQQTILIWFCLLLITFDQCLTDFNIKTNQNELNWIIYR